MKLLTCCRKSTTKFCFKEGNSVKHKKHTCLILRKINAMLILYDAVDFQIILKDVFYLRAPVFFMNQNIAGRVVDFIQ